MDSTLDLRGHEVLRERSRAIADGVRSSAGGGARRRPRNVEARQPGVRAEQFTVPGTDIEVTRTQALAGAAVVVLLIAVLFAGGRDRRGVRIID